jgi:hypothetical protein
MVSNTATPSKANDVTIDIDQYLAQERDRLSSLELLNKQRHDIDSQILVMLGKPVAGDVHRLPQYRKVQPATPHRVNGKGRSTGMTLRQVFAKHAVDHKPRTVAELTELAKEAGYKSGSKNFQGVVFHHVTHSKQFQVHSRGKKRNRTFVLAEPEAAMQPVGA